MGGGNENHYLVVRQGCLSWMTICSAIWNAGVNRAARISMGTLHEMFSSWLISWFGDIPWPAHSPILSANDFFLWGYF